MKRILLPYPPAFAKYCRYEAYEVAPVWVEGCISSKKPINYSDLFNTNLKFYELDRASIDALDEYALNIIDTNVLLNNFDIPNIDIPLTEIIQDDSLLNILKNNNQNSLADLSDLDANGISDIHYIGVKKTIFIIKDIQDYFDKDTSRKLIRQDFTKEDFEKILIEAEAEKYLIDDPRLAKLKFDIPITDISEDQHQNWRELLEHSLKFQEGIENKVSKIFLEFKKITDEIKQMDLPKQMEHIFLLKIKGNDHECKNNYTIKRVQNFNVVKDRLGIKESKKVIPTLEETSTKLEIKVTRERIRQIESKLVKSLDFSNGDEIFIPKLREILNTLNQNENKSKENIESIIKQKNFGSWNLERLLHCLDLFNIPNDFSIKQGLLTRKNKEKQISYILRIAKKITSYNGVINTNHLLKASNRDYDFNFSLEAIVDILDSKAEKLENDWYFFRRNSNLISSLAQKIANFSDTFTCRDVREAHRKYSTLRTASFEREREEYFFGFITPPTKIIRKILEKFEEYDIDDEKIKCNKILVPLADKSADSQFFDYFAARNFQPANYNEIRDFLVIKKGMSEGSFGQYMTYKPYLRRIETSVYGIVGAQIDETELSNTRERIGKKPKVKINWGNEEGTLVLKCRIEYVQSFVFSFRDFINYIDSDEFQILGDPKNRKIKRSGTGVHSLWHGLGSYLKDNYLELYDYISLVANLNKKTISVRQISHDEYLDF